MYNKRTVYQNYRIFTSPLENPKQISTLAPYNSQKHLKFPYSHCSTQHRIIYSAKYETNSTDILRAHKATENNARSRPQKSIQTRREKKLLLFVFRPRNLLFNSARRRRRRHKIENENFSSLPLSRSVIVFVFYVNFTNSPFVLLCTDTFSNHYLV